MDIYIIFLLMIIVFVGFWIQTVSGFGAMIFTIPLTMLLIDKSLYLPVGLLMAVLQSIAVVYKDREHILKKDFIILLSLAGIGAPIGLFLGDQIDSKLMNIGLGLFIIGNSGYALYIILRKINVDRKMKKYHYTFPVMSGFLQAAYGVGGPLIGTYMDKLTTHKRTYRVMISLYWIVLNPFILIGYFLRGDINLEHGQLFLFLFPVVLLALYVGNRTIDKISKKGFQIFVHTMLVSIAFTLFF
ncbi:MAG: hypothetical protein COA66_01170 [Arcobacter sp.]|nr:MAG: hypothetical protein COA66_01170 [Arcobacter sp.]